MWFSSSTLCSNEKTQNHNFCVCNCRWTKMGAHKIGLVSSDLDPSPNLHGTHPYPSTTDVQVILIRGAVRMQTKGPTKATRFIKAPVGKAKPTSKLWHFQTQNHDNWHRILLQYIAFFRAATSINSGSFTILAGWWLSHPSEKY